MAGIAITATPDPVVTMFVMVAHTLHLAKPIIIP